VRYLGHGVGLRLPHYQRALEGALDVDWLEVVTENFFGEGGRPRAVLEAVRREKPVVFHGVSLGVGSLGPPDARYLQRVAALARDFEPEWVSDHVCWTRRGGLQSHELLPLPLTEEALAAVAANVQRVQDALRRPLVLENVSSYVAYAASELSEWEFLAELSRRTGCALLLDCNNVLVSAHNHGFSPREYLAGLPLGAVAQLHLANSSEHPGYRFDDHRGPVPEAVWRLFEQALQRFGPVSTSIEWDEDLPAWEVLAEQAQLAARRARGVTASAQRDLGLPLARARHTSSGPRQLTSDAAPGLAALQRLFFDALTWPRGVRDYCDSTGQGPSLERAFVGSERLDALARLDVYANAYFYRLLGALREMFPRLAAAAGEVGFHNLVTDYVLAQPSTQPDLRRLGDRLPAFLREHALGRAAPRLVDLAELELALGSALDAADGAPLTREALAALPPEAWPALELELVPSARVLRVFHDLEGDGVASPERTVLVGRRGHAVYFRTLAAREALAVERLARGVSFDALCEALAEGGVEPGEIHGYLARWVDDGLIQTVARQS
jgi:uncharacterized protein (UPF0276 family)